MKMLFLRRAVAILSLALSTAMGPFALYAEVRTSEDLRCSLETSAWMVMNLVPDDPAGFYQLTLGYWPDDKNAFFLNGVTWKYNAPIGIPLGDPDFGDPSQEYPGYARDFGLGVGYQRMLWKGLFAAAYVTPFLKSFHPSNGDADRSGFQLYLQAQAGYQFDLFKGRFFVKPMLAFNYWPINTNFPASFREKEDRWPNYYLFEPHLNIGFRF
jgi:hypothetical protein